MATPGSCASLDPPELAALPRPSYTWSCKPPPHCPKQHPEIRIPGSHAGAIHWGTNLSASLQRTPGNWIDLDPQRHARPWSTRCWGTWWLWMTARLSSETHPPGFKARHVVGTRAYCRFSYTPLLLGFWKQPGKARRGRAALPRPIPTQQVSV